MANELAQTMTKYDSNSLKEDVSAIIHNLDPDETPALSNAGRRDINNTLFEWQTHPHHVLYFATAFALFTLIRL